MLATGIRKSFTLRRARYGLVALTALSSVLALYGCGGGGSSSVSPTQAGTLRVSLTDSPACGYDHVYVSVDHVEISSDGTSWTTIPVSASVSQPIDLLSLQNGALLTLGEAPLTAGTYQQVRLVLKPTGSGPPYANAIILSGTTTQIPLTTPSAQQSGYKILGPITVQPGTLADLTLDFNACKSIVAAGASNKYLLKPVVTATAQVVSGSVAGTTVPGSTVYAEKQSTSGPVIVVATVADPTTGAYNLSPILQSSSGGNVDVVIVPPLPASGSKGFATDIIQQVPVTAGAVTSLGSITPPASVVNLVSGTITVAGAAGAGNLVVDQTVAATPATYEIASTATTTGAYSFSLAASGPVVGVYNSGQPITFTPDTAAADVGIYGITATDAAGTVSGPKAVNVSAGAASNINFTLNP